MSEILWILYLEGALGGFDKYSDTWKNTIIIERNLSKKISYKEKFFATIQKHLLQFKLQLPLHGIKSFAGWVYEKPSRCPSTRLINEVFHKMVKNIGDIPGNSDLEDFSHIQCLPYVDLRTLDRRFYEYISHASKSLGIEYNSKITRSLNEILNTI